MAWSKVNPTEVYLAKKWHVQGDESIPTVAEHLGRDQPTITRLLLKRKVSKTQGRPPALTAAVVDRVENMLSDMTERSRMESMGGFVTWAKSWRK